MDNPDKAAQDFVESLADEYESPQIKAHRFTPSVKIGRRYLVLEDEKFLYHIQIDVEVK